MYVYSSFLPVTHRSTNNKKGKKRQNAFYNVLIALIVHDP